jgi:hypothetical protein
VKDGWFSSVERQIYKLDPVAGAEPGATRHRPDDHPARAPYQVLVEQNPPGFRDLRKFVVGAGGRLIPTLVDRRMPRDPGAICGQRKGFCMSTRDTMELKEETIRAQYEAALGW